MADQKVIGFTQTMFAPSEVTAGDWLDTSDALPAPELRGSWELGLVIELIPVLALVEENGSIMWPPFPLTYDPETNIWALCGSPMSPAQKVALWTSIPSYPAPLRDSPVSNTVENEVATQNEPRAKGSRDEKQWAVIEVDGEGHIMPVIVCAGFDTETEAQALHDRLKKYADPPCITSQDGSVEATFFGHTLSRHCSCEPKINESGAYMHREFN